MSGSVPAQGQSLGELGKTAADLISADTTIDYLGNVTGTLRYVDQWTAFSSDAAEQSGHYFPVHIDGAYQGKEITLKGTKTKTAMDLDWVILVKDEKSVFTFECEGKTILTLRFQGATFAPNRIAYAAQEPIATIRRTARKSKQ